MEDDESTLTSPRRVKLYILNDENQWDDHGTGHVVAVTKDERDLFLNVRSEATPPVVLLDSAVDIETNYQKQQETLIVWTEGDDKNLALSFQEKSGCDEVWMKLCQFFGKDPSVLSTLDEPADDDAATDNSNHSQDCLLPPVELAKLDDILTRFREFSKMTHKKEKLAGALIETDTYLGKLCDLFTRCEDLDDRESLSKLSAIWRIMLHLPKVTVLVSLVSDEVFDFTLGALEYDPENASSAKSDHRTFIREKVKFHRLPGLEDSHSELVSRIHRTYRLQYIHDILNPVQFFYEPETSPSTLTNTILLTKLEIVTFILQDDKAILQSIMDLIRGTSDKADSEDARLTAVFWLRELCQFASLCEPSAKDNFLATLAHLHIFSALEPLLAGDVGSHDAQAAAVEVLYHITEYSPSTVREYTMKSQLTTRSTTNTGGVGGQESFVVLLIELLLNQRDPDSPTSLNIVSIIRQLLDPENMHINTTLTDKQDWLAYFYRQCINVLGAYVVDKATSSASSPQVDDYRTAGLLQLILEIFIFCVESHGNHAKQWVITHDLPRRCLRFFSSRHGALRLTALRLSRKLLNSRDEAYLAYVTTSHYWTPIISALQACKRDNLWRSALWEIFEHVRADELRTVIIHLIECYSESLQTLPDPLGTFAWFRTKYDQLQELPLARAAFRNPTTVTTSPPRAAGSLVSEDERWLESDDIENQHHAEVSGLTAGDSLATSVQATSASWAPGASAAIFAPGSSNNENPSVNNPPLPEENEFDKMNARMIEARKRRLDDEEEEDVFMSQTNSAIPASSAAPTGFLPKSSRSSEDDTSLSTNQSANLTQPKRRGRLSFAGFAAVKKGLEEEEESEGDKVGSDEGVPSNADSLNFVSGGSLLPGSEVSTDNPEQPVDHVKRDETAGVASTKPRGPIVPYDDDEDDEDMAIPPIGSIVNPNKDRPVPSPAPAPPRTYAAVVAQGLSAPPDLVKGIDEAVLPPPAPSQEEISTPLPDVANDAGGPSSPKRQKFLE